MSHVPASNQGAQELAVDETGTESSGTAHTGDAVSEGGPEFSLAPGAAGAVSIAARMLELSLGGGIWLKGDDLANGTLPQICCLTGETPIVMRPYWFKNPRQWRLHGWMDLGSFIGANVYQSRSFMVRSLLPVSDRALKRRKLTTLWLVALASATLPLLILSAVLAGFLETSLMELSLLAAMLGLIALVGTVLLLVVYVGGVGLPRGTVHVDEAGHVHLLLKDPHPDFAAATRERYGSNYSRLGPYSRSPKDGSGS